MELNEIIKQKTEDFKKNVSGKPHDEKKLFHYNSVLNISQRIVLYKDVKANLLKEKLINYFDELEEMDYMVNSKLTSTKLYKPLLSVINYLFNKEQFLTKTDLHLLIIIGVIIDIGLYYFISVYHYPVFILLFFIWGLYRRKQAIKSNKYGNMFW